MLSEVSSSSLAGLAGEAASERVGGSVASARHAAGGTLGLVAPLWTRCSQAEHAIDPGITPELEELHRLREVLALATERKELEVRRWQHHEEQMATQVESQRREIEELRGWRQRAKLEAAEAALEERATKAHLDADRWRRQEEEMALQVARQRQEIEEMQSRRRCEIIEADWEKRSREADLREELASREAMWLQEWRDF